MIWFLLVSLVRLMLFDKAHLLPRWGGGSRSVFDLIDRVAICAYSDISSETVFVKKRNKELFFF